MLNITHNRIEKSVDLTKYKSTKVFAENKQYKIIKRIFVSTGILLLSFLFLPWTQNIKGGGYVTTLKPNQRPQEIQTTIAGRIEKWFVQEGDFVKKGDTIVYISEIKEDYLDPNLVQNTANQVRAKESAVVSYDQKVKVLEKQIGAIETEKKLKYKQAQNKLKQSYLKTKSDSIDLEVVKNQLKIARTQFNRSVNLHKEGLKPLTDVEEKRMKLQDLEAKNNTQENKYIAAKNDVLNAQMELHRIQAEYAEKVAKASSDKQTALSSQYDTEAQVNKLKNQYTNYKIRNRLYYITAPQDGYVNRALQSGVGETIKEGTSIVSIMPANFEIAVETYIDPIDFPLVNKGEKVRVWFDGWPTIVFSGWPGVSYGTFGGVIVAKENFISDNGKYRVLIAPNPKDKKWPHLLSIGAGAKTLALLNDVPIWFEIWRTLNGFPPNFYKVDNKSKEEKKK
ncbi:MULTISPECIES: HlyD family secretion protein [Flavobacterium]|uniref:HlyD family efflux transporter periplasmic adaptor subunit n=2 Tax=Flavobacterium TaxID=237 RepID=A0AA94F3M1_9FLAO|nr:MULTISPECIES: biotin/lipoyl-binding protein [Flavobacterium]OXA80257.1 biotin attachment protein [Flavobacterium columnare] [Flavobacterium columnare NBRC 100251 = ATCC 23463]AMA48277.1 biotin attachment protein [Flavobacterium covae]AND63559.1 biotin attachment protein [Flavobacterium covae]MCH4830196.1 HlyD family efflux transporter periplasmic adaptor subunit [Flavobacterium columnare]MCH4832422.1 HlyD family efflux transporter periplasmic adaptor subunit [Flavobacterium columnare]